MFQRIRMLTNKFLDQDEYSPSSWSQRVKNSNVQKLSSKTGWPKNMISNHIASKHLKSIVEGSWF